MKRLILSLALAASMLISVAQEPTKTPADGYPAFAIGGDLSWTDYLTALGKPKYYNGPSLASGQTTIPDIVTDYALDAVRLRVWVDPSGPLVSQGFTFKIGNSSYDVLTTHKTCDPVKMAAMARLYADRGLRVMVAFHLSDTWADPARQFIPASWADCTTAEELTQRAVEHVTSTLELLRQANVNVAWVQIGNEVNAGCLKYNLPSATGATVTEADYGCAIGADNGKTRNFVNLFAACAQAARTVYPDAKTVLHLANSQSWNSVNWTLNYLKRQGFNSEMCDYVGLSLYPCDSGANYDKTALWQGDTDNAIASIASVYSSYGYRALLCEIGMNNEWSESTSSTSQAGNIAQCNTDVQAFTQYLFAHLADAESTCDGFFYWAPEVDYLDNYKKGACYDFQGSWKRQNVTPNPWWAVCKEHSTFPAGGLVDFTISSGIESVAVDSDTPAEYYNLQGVRVLLPAPGQLIIERRSAEVRKVIF